MTPYRATVAHTTATIGRSSRTLMSQAWIALFVDHKGRPLEFVGNAIGATARRVLRRLPGHIPFLLPALPRRSCARGYDAVSASSACALGPRGGVGAPRCCLRTRFGSRPMCLRLSGSCPLGRFAFVFAALRSVHGSVSVVRCSFITTSTIASCGY